MNPIKKLFFWLTAWFPRQLPRTAAEFSMLKFVLVNAFGVRDRPQTWMTLVGQITSTPANCVRRPIVHFVNAIQRLDINELAQNEKIRQIDILKAQFEVAVKREAEREAAEKTAEQPVPEATNGTPSVN